MIMCRDQRAAELGLDLIVHNKPDGLARHVGPVTHGSAYHTNVMKTVALKQALTEHKFDFAFGGARRDEEKSRRPKSASFPSAIATIGGTRRASGGTLVLYNTRKNPDESIRVFPLSNWTEIDIWTYVASEGIPIPDFISAKERPVVERDGQLIMVDDEGLLLDPGETPRNEMVRSAHSAAISLTGAIRQPRQRCEIIQELLLSTSSERPVEPSTPMSAHRWKTRSTGYFWCQKKISSSDIDAYLDRQAKRTRCAFNMGSAR